MQPNRFSLALLGSTHVGDRLTGSVVGVPERVFPLVAYLLTENTASVSRRGSVAAFLWEDAERAKALVNLRGLLRRLRRLERETGLRLVTGDREVVQLDPNAAVDLRRLHVLACDASADAAVELCELYRGDLLDDIYLGGSDFSAWLATQRLRVRELFVSATTQFLERSDPDHDGAIEAVATRLLVLEPLLEHPYRALMRLHAIRDRPKALRDVYESCRACLSRELGERPSETTIRLYERLSRSRVAQQTGIVVPIRSHVRIEQAAAAAAPAVSGSFGAPRICILPPQASLRGRTFHIAAALLDEVATGLCRLHSLTVIAPYTAWRLTGDPIEAASRFGVDYVVDSRLETKGSARLFVKLVRTSGRQIIWANDYPFDAESTSQRYGDIAKLVAGMLADAVERSELSRLEVTDRSTAYNWYLAGQRYMRSLDLPNVRRARKAFRTALEIAPEFMPALSSVARTNIVEWLLLGRADKQLLDEACHLARQSIERDPINSAGFKELGRAELFLGQLEASLERLSRAESLAPSHADTLADHADALMHNSRMAEAHAKMNAALELNPIAPDEYLWTAGGIAFFLYRYEEGLSYLLKMSDTSPANKLIAACAAMLDHADITQEFVRRHMEVYPDFRVDRWAATIPMLGKQDVDHYVGALRAAGFHLD